MALTTFANAEARSSIRTKLNNTTQQRARVRLTSSAAAAQADAVIDSQLPPQSWVIFDPGGANQEVKRISSRIGQTHTMDSNFANTHAADVEIVAIAEQPTTPTNLNARTTPTTSTTDSAAPLQAWLDDVEVEGEGGVVLMPPGVYDLETAIDVPQGITIIGGNFVAQGGLGYVFGSVENDVSFIDMTIHGDTHDGISCSDCKRQHIENVRFFGGDGSAVRLANVQDANIVNCEMRNGSLSPYESNADIWDEAVLIPGGTGQTGTDITVLNCKSYAPKVGAFISNDTVRFKVINCYWEDVDGNGTNTGYGAQAYNTGLGESTNYGCEFRGNHGEGADGIHIYIQGTKECICDDNTLRDGMRNLAEDPGFMAGCIGCVPDASAYTGGYYIGGRQDTFITRNRCIDTTGGPGIAFSGDRVHVMDNFIESPKHYGITSRGTANGHITGNDYKACPTDFYHWTTAAVRSNTLQAHASPSTECKLDSGASGSNDTYNGNYILITGGTGRGQRRFITNYVGATFVCTISEAWDTQPDATSTYTIEGNRWDNMVVRHGMSDRGIEARFLASTHIEEGEDDYYMEREFTAVTDLTGGNIGQIIRIYNSYSGITWYHQDNSANVDSPITFKDNANWSSLDHATSGAHGILTLRKGGVLFRPSKVIHDDNGVLTALAAVIDDDYTSSGSTISFVAAEDRLLVCFPRPFYAIQVWMGATKNALASTISSVKLSTGETKFVPTTLLRDHTQSRDSVTGENGKTFSANGQIQWIVPEDASWDDDTYDTTTGRWVELKFSADWTASVVIEEIDILSWGWVEIGNHG